MVADTVEGVTLITAFRLKRIAAAVAVAVMLSGTAIAGPWEDGLVAYERGDYATALQQWRPLAEHGNADAQRKLGIIYDDGLGVPEDDLEAMRWYRLAAEQGDWFAEGMLLFLEDAEARAAFKSGDYATVLRLIRPLAMEGDAEAQNLLGQMYYLGEGVPRDDGLARLWYKLAAQQGNAGAQYSLGAMYYYGFSEPQDFAEAAKWWRLAAQQGTYGAQENLGFMYLRGEGVPQDYVLAHMWFNLAAAQGDDDAIKGRELVAELMTTDQIAEAQRLAREWKPKPER